MPSPSPSPPLDPLFSSGREAPSTPVLVAAILGWRGEDGVRRAGDLLTRVDGDLTRLLRARDALGLASRRRLRAALELGRRWDRARIVPPDRLRGPEDVVRLLGPTLRALSHEEFHVLLLNTRHRVLGTRLVSRGILDASLVHPREVFAPALELRASALILVHNHPSGDPHPSPEDHRVTEQMAQAGEILGIRVLDHVVVGDPGWSSVPVRRPERVGGSLPP